MRDRRWIPPGALAAASIVLVGALLGGCSGAQGAQPPQRPAAQSTGQSQAQSGPGAANGAATAVEATPPGPTAVASGSATVVAPVATATAPSATATPAAVLPLRIAAQLDPPVPHAGMEFVLQLTISNDGARPSRGVYIATSGPWDRWTVLEITPAANLARDAAGWRIVSDLAIPPRETRTIEVHLRADAASEDQLTFAVREAEQDELR